MTVIDYQSSLDKRRYRLRWLVAVIAGAVTGLAVAQIAFEPMLRVLSNGQQYYVFDVSELFRTRTQFALVMALGGIVTGISIAAACHPARILSIMLWAVVFCIVFSIGASLGLIYARGKQSAVAGLGLSFASAPTLIAPIAGAVAVVLALGVILPGRGMATRPAE